MAGHSITSLGVAAGVLLAVYKLIIEPLFISPLSKIPAAHFTSQVSPFWIYYVRYSNTENRTLYELHKLKGPIVRLAPNELSINCYEQGIKTVYTGDFDKPDWYGRRFNNFGSVTNMFSMKDSKSHAARKRMLSNVYAKSFVLASPTTRETTKSIIFDRYLPVFRKSADTNTPVEVLSLSYAYSKDSFMAYQFGLSLASDFIRNRDQRNWYLKNFFDRRSWLFWTVEVPSFTSFLLRFGIRSVPKHCDDAGQEIEQWTLRICDKAEALLSAEDLPLAANMPVIFAQQRAAMRKQELDSKSRYDPNLVQTPQPYPRRLEIASDMHCHSAAALETSGDTLAYIYYGLSCYPEIQARLRQELMTLDHPLLLPLPGEVPGKLADFKILDSLPILDAVLQESLRLWSPTPGPQPRVTPAQPCTLVGYKDIPAGVRVQAASFSLHRNAEVFPDPEAWIPDRWLDATPTQLTEMRHWFWAWGSGGRMCIGSNIAIHTMKFAIASIYTNFTSSVVEAPLIEQEDGFTAGPKGKKVILQYKRV